MSSFKETLKASSITARSPNHFGISLGLLQPTQPIYQKQIPTAPVQMISIEQDSEQKMITEATKLNSLSIKCQKFKTLLSQKDVDFDQLRKLSWTGIPEEIRPTVWKLLFGYLPGNFDRRETTLHRKRSEYKEFIIQAKYSSTPPDQSLYHQIHIDIQRTNAHIKLYNLPKTRLVLERILYIWAIRHPASGYVQGINDLLTPFFHVFLGEYCEGQVSVEEFGMDIDDEKLEFLEADCYWCLTKLLDGIQDSYTHAQPGITRQVGRLKELINRIDGINRNPDRS
jgi:TBC1 domain family member 2